MTRAEAARLGGLARAAKLSPERRSEIARMGFTALVNKRFGGVRSKAVAHLLRGGKIPPDRPGSAVDLRALHQRLFPFADTEEKPHD